MKGATGILLAIFLGALAMVFNWAYLETRMNAVKTVSLAGIAPDARLEPGDILRGEQLVEVKVPSANAQTLETIAYLYQDRASLIGMRVTRGYTGGDLILRRDYRTPPQEVTLAQDERLIWIPVDSRSFVPELLNPGDEVTFLVPVAPVLNPTEESLDEEDVSPSPVGLTPATPLSTADAFGPFRVASIGSRLASHSVAQSVRAVTMQDRQVGIIVKAKEQSLEPRALQLLDRLGRNDYRHVSVILHPRTQRDQ